METYKKLLVTGAVFLGGYLIGFYEYKYKVTQALLRVMTDKTEESQK